MEEEMEPMEEVHCLDDIVEVLDFTPPSVINNNSQGQGAAGIPAAGAVNNLVLELIPTECYEPQEKEDETKLVYGIVLNADEQQVCQRACGNNDENNWVIDQLLEEDRVRIQGDGNEDLEEAEGVNRNGGLELEGVEEGSAAGAEEVVVDRQDEDVMMEEVGEDEEMPEDKEEVDTVGGALEQEEEAVEQEEEAVEQEEEAVEQEEEAVEQEEEAVEQELNLDYPLNLTLEYPLSIDEEECPFPTTSTQCSSPTVGFIGPLQDPTKALGNPVNAAIATPKVMKINLNIPRLTLKAPKPLTPSCKSGTNPTPPSKTVATTSSSTNLSSLPCFDAGVQSPEGEEITVNTLPLAESYPQEPTSSSTIFQQSKPTTDEGNDEEINDGEYSEEKEEDVTRKVTRVRAKRTMDQRCSCRLNPEDQCQCPQSKSKKLKATDEGETTNQKGTCDDEEEGDIYFVEEILKSYYEKDRKWWWYFVKWEGYPNERNEWIPEHNFIETDCLASYWDKILKKVDALNAPMEAPPTNDSSVVVDPMSFLSLE